MNHIPKILPYKYILFISMLFITIDLSAVSVSYKMVELNGIFAINSGATYIFPLTYCLGDIVTEVYGYKMAKNLIWYSLALQFVYCFFIKFVVALPSPSTWHHDESYQVVFGSIVRFVTAGTVANIASNFINIYIVSKLKIPLKGRLFWARSLLSTIVSGFLMAFIIVSLGFYGKDLDIAHAITMFNSTFTLEVLYSLILIIPAAIAARQLKVLENVDVYDFNTNFNPFAFNL